MGTIFLFKAVVLFVGVVMSFVFFTLASKVAFASKGDYEINRRRSGGLFDPLFGRVKTSHDGYRDFRVCAGLAVDKKTNTWVEQGILSDEAVDAVLYPNARLK